jgi:hypothetical protein
METKYLEVPNTDKEKIQSVAVYSVMSGCVWKNVLKHTAQKLISNVIKLFEYTCTINYKYNI